MGSNDETIQMNNLQSALDVKSGISLCNGRYKLLKVLGKGGFGITYLGLHTGLNKKVAIKEYFPKDSFRRQSDGTQVSYSNTGENRKNIERFLKEARTMAELKHKGVVSVSDVFEENATAYYVMDYIEGQSLEDKGTLSESAALKYIDQVAQALKYIHDKGILHLDIKPANIMIDQEDNAVLIDFGISKHYDGGGEATSTTTVGYSAGYSPIEQMTPGGLKQFTPSTDIYALGATIYKIISGTKPPASTDLADDATLTKPDGMSQALFCTVSKCMEQKRKDRPQTMDEVIALLNKEPNQSAPSLNLPNPSPSPKFDPKFRKVFFVIIGLAIVIGVSVFTFQRLSKPTEKTEATPQIFEKTETTPETLIEIPGVEYSSFNVNGVQFKMVKVEGGTFQMGCTSEQGCDAYYKQVEVLKKLNAALGEDTCDYDHVTVHSVTLSDYYIGQTQVTQELWQVVMGNNPSYFKGDNQRPMENVSWNDCQEFIEKLNRLTGKNFRLPTEAEWEYAARGGNKSKGYKYSGSNDADAVAWYDDNSGGKTHAVATKQANELGLYDMSGNVLEWCQDWYDYYTSRSQSNPKGANTGSSRVLRGGRWRYDARYVRVSYRDYGTPDLRYCDYGLRLAL